MPWERVKEIPQDPRAYKIIQDWAVRNKLVLGGTTAIETGGIKLVRQPRDVEFFTGVSKAQKTILMKELARDLNKLNTKNLGEMEFYHGTSPKNIPKILKTGLNKFCCLPIMKMATTKIAIPTAIKIPNRVLNPGE